MATGNNVTLVGNITRDPELRFTASGQAKANFGIAVNRRWQNRQSQEWEEATSFFNVVCWGDMGENVGESIQKGARILVTGRLEQRSWETEQGEKRVAALKAETDKLEQLLEANTDLTKQDKELTEQVATLTREIHAFLSAGRAS